MVVTGSRELNRKQRKELALRLRAQDPGLDIVHPHNPDFRSGRGILRRRTGVWP